MIEVGVITEINRGKARVAIGSMVSDFLPVLQHHFMVDTYNC